MTCMTCFKSCGLTRVAVKFTDVYWIPAFEILEGHWLNMNFVNALRQECAGAETGCQRCQMVERFYGHLRGSFRLEAEIATLHANLHQRARLVEHTVAHIQHMRGRH